MVVRRCVFRSTPPPKAGSRVFVVVAVRFHNVRRVVIDVVTNGSETAGTYATAFKVVTLLVVLLVHPVCRI